MVTEESSEKSVAGSSAPSTSRWVDAPFGSESGSVRRTSTRPSL